MCLSVLNMNDKKIEGDEEITKELQDRNQSVRKAKN